MAGSSPIREPIINPKTGRLTPVWERYFILTVTPVIERLLEKIPTNFEDGSIPFVEDGFLVEDNANLAWDNINDILSALDIIIPNLTAERLMSSDADKKLVSVAALTAWIAGSDLQTVNDDGDGTASHNDDNLEFFIQAVS